MLKNIRDDFDEMFDSIVESMRTLDNLIEVYEEKIIINNLEHFIEKLKLENLYSKELEMFIDEYLKYYNQ